MTEKRAEIPKIFAPLMTTDFRYKLFYGGRMGGKSYAFADSLLFLGRMKKLRIACMREVQESIKDSVHKLLSDRIRFYELSDYQVLQTKIVNRLTGTSFIFKGLNEQSAQNIKSLEGIDIVWLEEGQKISKHSWDILNPTIRKAGSQIWISMNRETENDPVWQAVAQNPDEHTLVVKVNYTDNPFCSDEMLYLAEKCKRENPDDYAHIWLGAPLAQANNRLISSLLTEKARKTGEIYTTSPLIIGLDVARFGDDSTVFCFRRGRYCFRFDCFKGLDNVEVANRATFYIREYKPAKMFVDAGGVGAGVVDILNDRGFKKIVQPVMFGSKAFAFERYHNRRAEMWDELRAWLASKQDISIPDDEALCAELCSIAKKYDDKGRLQLEEKDELKKRLGRSPDKADALALTFAEPVYEQDSYNEYTPESIEYAFRTINKSNSGW